MENPQRYVKVAKLFDSYNTHQLLGYVLYQCNAQGYLLTLAFAEQFGNYAHKNPFFETADLALQHYTQNVPAKEQLPIFVPTTPAQVDVGAILQRMWDFNAAMNVAPIAPEEEVIIQP